MRRAARSPMAGLLALAALLLAGCGLATDPSPEDTVTTGAAPPPSTDDPEDVDATTSEGPSTSASPPAEADLPGEVVEGFPEAGTDLAIVCVGAQEILNLRLGPGIDFESVLRMPPDTTLLATGRNRDLGGGAGLWYQVRAGDDVGWVISSYVAALGANRDVTDRFDPPPSASTPGALLDAVVAGWDDGGDAVTVFGPVVVDDLQARVDVLDGDDDAVLGARLFVVAAASDGTFTVTKVTATQLCARGVSGTGVCA